MPSRFATVLIVVFWLATTGYVFEREIRPRYFADGPPPILIDLVDEAAHAVPVRWTIYRGDQILTTLTTRMEYDKKTGTFLFNNRYGSFTLDRDFGVESFRLEVRGLETELHVARTGAILGQRLTGELIFSSRSLLGTTSESRVMFKVDGTVVDGNLIGQSQLYDPAPRGSGRIWSESPFLTQQLEPVPVPEGHALTPMSPVARLGRVSAGQRWVIRSVDPLSDSIKLTLKEFLKKSNLSEVATSMLSRGEQPVFIAEAGTEIENYQRHKGPPIACRKITYRTDDNATLRTWVSDRDGRVICQEASLHAVGEVLRFERED